MKAALHIGWGSVGLAEGTPSGDRRLRSFLAPGQFVELSGGISCGKSSLALGLCAEATAAGEVAVWIDPGLGFFPLSLVESASDAGRLLVVRVPDCAAALRAADLLLSGGGTTQRDRVRLVVLPLPAHGRMREASAEANRSAIAPAALLRLQRMAERCGAAVLLLDERPPEAPSLGPVQLRCHVTRDAEGVVHLEVLRHRQGPAGGTLTPTRADPVRLPRGRTL